MAGRVGRVAVSKHRPSMLACGVEVGTHVRTSHVTTRLDRVGSVPLYLQIAELLRTQVREGHYPPGVALPSERKLMDEYGVTRATVRNALAELRAEGLIVMERGAGAFV